MEILGKSTINPFIFYTGKISGYFTWLVLLLAILNIVTLKRINFYYNYYIAYCIILAGLVFIILSLVFLGRSTRVGLPSESTKLKTNGIYKFSRNPMYIGVHLITIASMIYFLNIVIIVAGMYSLIVYHLIILNEERFLLERFGTDYENYTRKVRRYF